MSAKPTERELELGMDVGTDVYGEGEMGSELGTRIAELLAERRELAYAEIESLRDLLDPDVNDFWAGHVDGLSDALRLVKRSGRL